MKTNTEELPRILVVDDQTDNLQVVGTTLRNTKKYRINFAQSGEEALQLIESIPPQLILLDIMMPGMGGYEVCKRLKQDERYRDIPIIFLSANVTTEDMVDGFQVGGADYITKPFDSSLLLARVNTQLKIYLAHQREERIKQNMERIFASMNEGLLVFSADGTVETVNPVLEKLTGMDRDELLHQPYQNLFKEEEGSKLGPLFTERDLLQKNGRFIPVQVSGTALHATENALEDKTVMVIHDMRDYINAENANRANRARDEFLASMSHELRTPLTSIIGNSELLSDCENDSEKQKIIRSIESAGRFQLALVNDILDMSKIDSGKFSIDKTPYDLTALIDEITHIFAVRAQDAGLDLQVTVKQKPQFQLIGDSRRVGQILINLLGNAIKFTEKGGIQLTIWNTGQQLNFSVADTGIGINTEVLDRLFGRFEQADASISRRFGGTGLGLYISESLAHLMGGAIHVTSTVGQGSTFQLTLPYKVSNLPVASSSAMNATNSNSPRELKGTVLIAEDTPELQLLERRILQSMGDLEVLVASNGAEAIQLTEENTIDLILMDMQMPVMDGIEATQKLKTGGYKPPIIALTANVMQKHRDAFFSAGCDDFLSKPINREELRVILNQYLLN